MATTIKLKNSVTTTNAPSSLVQGEVAINITDKKVWVGNAATTPIQLLGAGSSASFGALTCTSLTNSGLTSGRVTYASTGGLLADSANFTFNGTTVTMANDASISGLTVGKGAGSIATNTAVGASALAANTTGNQNVAVGSAALIANTTGLANVGIGTNVLISNTTGQQNTALGHQVLYANTGDYNTGAGSNTLRFNTSGANNTAYGFNALFSNTTASNNTAVGYQAAYSNTTGTGFVAMGYQALQNNSTGGYGVAIGFQAGQANTTGNNLVAIGSVAVYKNTTGAENVGVGAASLATNTTGSYNVAIGSSALTNQTTAPYNTAVGYQAGYSGTTHTESVYIGAVAGYSATTNKWNTFVGSSSGYLTTGGFNTFIGQGAGYNITTGTKNTILGQYSGNQGGLDIRTASNYIVLSDGDGNPRAYWDNGGAMLQYGTIGGGNSLNVYNQSATGYGISCLVNNNVSSPYRYFEGYSLSSNTQRIAIYTNGDVKNTNNSYGALSDIKLKQDIVDASSQWNDIKNIKVRKYRFKAEPDAPLQIGVIAQEIEQVSAGLVETQQDEIRDEKGAVIGLSDETTKSVKYSVLYMKAIKALQEAMERIETLEAKVSALESK